MPTVLEFAKIENLQLFAIAYLPKKVSFLSQIIQLSYPEPFKITKTLPVYKTVILNKG